jgi:hypothetical protein
MLTFATKYGWNKFSQFNEDGIIDEIFARVDPELFNCVEFGGHDGFFCSNTRHLINEGWDGKMYDIEPGSPDVEKKRITPDNVNEIGECALLSIDVDNDDYHIWQAYKKKPDVVVIEVNSSLMPPHEEIPGNRGASYISMVKLGISKGYFLLAHTGNCIFILNKHKKLFPEITGDALNNWQEYFNTSHL